MDVTTPNKADLIASVPRPSNWVVRHISIARSRDCRRSPYRSGQLSVSEGARSRARRGPDKAAYLRSEWANPGERSVGMSRKLGVAVVGLVWRRTACVGPADAVGSYRGLWSFAAARRPATFSETYGFPAADNLESLLHNPNVEALILITPPNARRDIVTLLPKRKTYPVGKASRT